jgi:mono/diheme cytochrome c family protein
MPMERIFIAAITALLTLGLLAVNAQSNEQQGQQTSEGQLGQEIYILHGCAGCHGNEGQGVVGPPLAGNQRLQDTEYVINQILHGGGGMPSFKIQLSDEQIAVVATYERTSWGNSFGEVTAEQVAQQRQNQQQQQGQEQEQSHGQEGQHQGQQEEQQTGEEARRQLGEQLYGNVGCAGCHSGKGAGGVGPALSNNSRLRDDQYVVYKILNGGEGMPAWSDRLTDQQVAAIATYIRTSWGNDFGAISVEQVAQQPAQHTHQGDEPQGEEEHDQEQGESAP